MWWQKGKRIVTCKFNKGPETKEINENEKSLVRRYSYTDNIVLQEYVTYIITYPIYTLQYLIPIKCVNGLLRFNKRSSYLLDDEVMEQLYILTKWKLLQTVRPSTLYHGVTPTLNVDGVIFTLTPTHTT